MILYRIRLTPRSRETGTPHWFALTGAGAGWRFTINGDHATDFNDLELATSWYNKVASRWEKQEYSTSMLVIMQYDGTMWTVYPYVELTTTKAIDKLTEI